MIDTVKERVASVRKSLEAKRVETPRVLVLQKFLASCPDPDTDDDATALLGLFCSVRDSYLLAPGRRARVFKAHFESCWELELFRHGNWRDLCSCLDVPDTKVATPPPTRSVIVDLLAIVAVLVLIWAAVLVLAGDSLHDVNKYPHIANADVSMEQQHSMVIAMKSLRVEAMLELNSHRYMRTNFLDNGRIRCDVDPPLSSWAKFVAYWRPLVDGQEYQATNDCKWSAYVSNGFVCPPLAIGVNTDPKMCERISRYIDSTINTLSTAAIDTRPDALVEYIPTASVHSDVKSFVGRCNDILNAARGAPAVDSVATRIIVQTASGFNSYMGCAIATVLSLIVMVIILHGLEQLVLRLDIRTQRGLVKAASQLCRREVFGPLAWLCIILYVTTVVYWYFSSGNSVSGFLGSQIVFGVLGIKCVPAIIQAVASYSYGGPVGVGANVASYAASVMARRLITVD